MCIGSSHEQRFNTQLYRSYVHRYDGNEFKFSNKEEFYSKLSSILEKRVIKELDKNDIYRLADKKVTWLGKYDRVLGEVWYEENEVSYWIKKEFL